MLGGKSVSIAGYEVTAARSWLRDCSSVECEWSTYDVPAMTVVHAVHREYEGGWEQFVADGLVSR